MEITTGLKEDVARLKAELQKAYDRLTGMENQRNHHSNDAVNIAAELLAAQRIIAERDAKIAELEAKLQELEAPKANGHAAEATA